MRKLIFIAVLLVGCTKGQKALESGTWNFDSYTYNGSVHNLHNATVQFANGKMTLKNGVQYVYDYTADNNVITVGGSTVSYKASKKKLHIDLALYPLSSDINDPLPAGSSELSK